MTGILRRPCRRRRTSSCSSEYIPVGADLVLVPQRIVSLGRDGIETIAHNSNLYTLRGGRAVRVKIFQTKAAALEALGLAD